MLLSVLQTGQKDKKDKKIKDEKRMSNNSITIFCYLTIYPNFLSKYLFKTVSACITINTNENYYKLKE